jgi:hypothetical protein
MVTDQRLQRNAGGCGTGKLGQTDKPKRKRRILGTFNQSGQRRLCCWIKRVRKWK